MNQCQQETMKYPDCTHNVPHGVKTILVALATGTCFWEAEPEKSCKPKTYADTLGCSNVSGLKLEYGNGLVEFDVHPTSRSPVLLPNTSLVDPGNGDYYCNVSIPNITLGRNSWLTGTHDCIITHLVVKGENVRVENVTVLSYGELNGNGLELVDISSDKFAVIKPDAGEFETSCEGLSVTNSLVAVGACRDSWTVSGPDGIALYQASQPPAVVNGAHTISVDGYIGIYGRDYEQRFVKGVTNIDNQKKLLSGAALIAAFAIGFFLLVRFIIPG